MRDQVPRAHPQHKHRIGILQTRPHRPILHHLDTTKIKPHPPSCPGQDALPFPFPPANPPSSAPPSSAPQAPAVVITPMRSTCQAAGTRRPHRADSSVSTPSLSPSAGSFSPMITEPRYFLINQLRHPCTASDPYGRCHETIHRLTAIRQRRIPGIDVLVLPSTKPELIAPTRSRFNIGSIRRTAVPCPRDIFRTDQSVPRLSATLRLADVLQVVITMIGKHVPVGDLESIQLLIIPAPQPRTHRLVGTDGSCPFKDLRQQRQRRIPLPAVARLDLKVRQQYPFIVRKAGQYIFHVFSNPGKLLLSEDAG